MVVIDWHPSNRKLRQFAIAFVIFALIFFGARLRSAPWDSPVGVGLLMALLFSSVALLWPKLAHWPFVVLSLVTFPIGLVVSYAVLMFFFYTVVTPIAMALRWSGRDTLRLRRTDQKTYWVTHSPAPGPDYYLSQ